MKETNKTRKSSKGYFQTLTQEEFNQLSKEELAEKIMLIETEEELKAMEKLAQG